MIPKIIHFCWLSGDPFPEKIQYCIDSWKIKLPDYEFVLWDLNRFSLSESKWVAQAFESKKYAFAADYIRCYALYNYGGIYLDSDVEVLKSFNDLLNLPYFLCYDFSGLFEPAIIGCEKGNVLFKVMLDYYSNRDFILMDGSFSMLPLPNIMEAEARKVFDINSINKITDFDDTVSVLNVFSYDFFSPKRQDNFKIIESDNTHTIHHFNASWYTSKQNVFRLLSKFIGFKNATRISTVLKVFK